jgi:leucyl aminopeptidase (aminopeptidase T)
MSRDDENKKLIESLLAERDELLKSNPELIPLQKEIDRALNEAGSDPVKRAEKAHEMLEDMVKNEFLPELDRAKGVISAELEKLKNDVDVVIKDSPQKRRIS